MLSRISIDAIRRDLRELSRQGLLQRVHGGAISSSPAITDYAGRELLSREIKDKLGRAAAGMIQAGQVIALDGGTTTLQLARHLPRDLRATVVTHSPVIATELRDHHGVDVLLLGGRLFKHSMVSIGTETIEALKRIHFDLFFLGATGVHPESGITTGDWEEAAVKRAFCSRAAEVVLMASPEKLNAASPYEIIPLAELGSMIVDETTPKLLTESFNKIGITVIHAK